MLHPHLEQYPTAIELVKQLQDALEAKGIKLEEFASFQDIAFLDNDSIGPFNEVGYNHHTTSGTLIQISLKMYFESDEECESSLKVTVGIFFFDNHDEKESKCIKITYEVATATWDIRYVDIHSFESPMGNQLADQLSIKLGETKPIKEIDAFRFTQMFCEQFNKQ
jgi:hypothetical protein